MHKTTLELAGIGLSRFKPHSIRSASASAAAGFLLTLFFEQRVGQDIALCKVLQETNSTMQHGELAEVLLDSTRQV